MKGSMNSYDATESTLLLPQSGPSLSGNRRTRSPPFAQLETLSSFSVWMVLILPFLLASLTIFIDLNKSLHMESFRFSVFNCPHPAVCNAVDGQLHVLLNIDPATMHHLTLKGKMKLYDDSVLKYGTQVVMVGNDDIGSWTQTFLEVLKTNIHASPGYLQIGGFSTDRPWLLSESKYIRIIISVTNSYSTPSMDLLERMTFKIDFQSRWFSASRAILQIALSIISCYTLVLWSRRVATHHIRLRESAMSQGLLRDSSFGTQSYYCFMSYLVPEQIYTILLLMSLILWQDLPGACFVIARLLSYDTQAASLFVASLVKLYGQQDVRGESRRDISTSRGAPTADSRPEYGTMERHAEEDVDGEECSGEEVWWESRSATPPGSRGSTGAASCRTGRTMSRPATGGRKGPSQGGRSRGTTNKRYSGGGYEWLNHSASEEEGSSDDNTLGSDKWSKKGRRDTGSRRGKGVTKMERYSTASVGCRRSGVGTLNRQSSGNGGSKQTYQTKPALAPTIVQRYALCRSYVDTSTDELPLVESHPCSSSYFDFVIGWVLLYLLFLLLVTCQNLFTFPEVLDALLALTVGINLEQGLYAFFTLFPTPIRLIWIVLIWKALALSALRLKEARYMNSRYQQVAFRLFVNQIMVGLGLLCATYLFQIYHFVEVMRKRTSNMSSLSDIWSSGIVVADNGFGEWGGRDAEIGELIYVSCICYMIAFLFATPTMESYQDLYQHSEKGLAGTAHEYLVLEHANPRMEEEYNVSFEKCRRQHAAELMGTSINTSPDVDIRSLPSRTSPSKMSPFLRRVKSRASKRFCLETACILMECSWQTYFMPLDEPRSEAEAAARLTCQDIFSSALGTAVMLKMNVAQYGLRFVRSFLSTGGDISGFVARDDRRVIVSFRGTVGGSNMVTDLNMFQTQLPDFSLSDSVIHQLFREVVNEQKINDPEWNLPDAESDKMWKDILDRSRGGQGSDGDDSLQGSPLSTNFILRSASNSIGGGSINRPSADRLSTLSIASDDSNARSDGSGSPSCSGEGHNHTRRGGLNRICRCLQSVVSIIPVARQALPLVHSGFLLAYKSSRDDFLKAVLLGMLEYYKEKREALYQSQKRASHDSFRHSTDDYFTPLDGLGPDFRYPLDLYICGHSLGGALSVLAALDLHRNAKYMLRIIMNYLFSDLPVATCSIPQVSLTVYTFGSPRIGNGTFSKMVERSIKDTFRIEVDGDVICRIPRLLGMYRHCGVHIIVDSEESGNLIVNPTVVEDQLLRRGSGTTDLHSLAKYRVCLEACFLPHELDAYLRQSFLHAERLERRGAGRGTNPFDDEDPEEYRRLPHWM